MKPSKELLSIAKRAAKYLGLPKVPGLRVANRRRGRAYPRQGYFYIPLWATLGHSAYTTHYIIHELTHFAPNMGYGNAGPFRGWLCRDHGPEFRRKEAETCERFGLRLVYRGTAYVDHIRDLETGQAMCDQYGRPVPRFDVGL